MKTTARWIRILGLALVAISLAAGCTRTPPSAHAQKGFTGDEGSKPYTHLRFQNNPNNFQLWAIAPVGTGLAWP